LADGEIERDFVALYEIHYPRLVRCLEIAGASRSRAEDVAQEAFARTLGHWRRVRRGSNPAGYVFRVAFRLVRRRSRELSFDGDVMALGATIVGSGPADGDSAALASLQSTVSAVIEEMPTGRRSCAVLCLVVEMSPKEAGRALGIAESTVRKQLERARADLRVALEINP
jgi:RNA polymerase sigma factor (sigma-70 family)